MDNILRAFLERQYQDALALNDASDLVTLIPLSRSHVGDLTQRSRPLAADEDPPQHYVARFACKGPAKVNGRIVDHNDWSVGICFPDNYLRAADPATVLTWLAPMEIYHPNIRPPFVCAGKIAPGTDLVDIVYRVFDMIRMENVTTVETDSLNPESCSWARDKIAGGAFPIDKRPLKRRQIQLSVSSHRPEAQ